MDDVVHVTRLMERYQSLHYALESAASSLPKLRKVFSLSPKIVFATP